MKTIYGFWECDFCEERFVRESSYNKHRCELKERAEFLKNTKRGRFSFLIYQEYLRCRGFRKPKLIDFINSKYYNSILNFADYYYKMLLPDMKDYVGYVTEMELLPHFWARDDVYEVYISSYDDRVEPFKQMEITFDHIRKIARGAECSPSQLFDFIELPELTRLIQSRRFSPWVLLSSDRFYRYMSDITEDERIVLEAMINIDAWAARFKKFKKERKLILGAVREFGL